MTTLETKYHGQIEANQEEFWLFESGIPGFVDEKEFALIAFPENDVFHVLQSTTTPELGFVVTNPFAFAADYQFKLEDSTVSALSLEKPEDALALVILNVQEPFEKTTANLQAPLIFNTANRKAKQVILNDSGYQTRQRILTPAEEKE
ncbi:flagellar assembly protein FliW [Jeotgalibacillus campisalis]|uniref:Flagellar assembly factor FliW n=1 Tax=Jeotgalibacillus campisalis TaxID=220754 RepID=A0A0C2RMJ3_9BACL|nr:flagellar assembly protein FliW [Jeotgalibacillus campisalis]KIL42974.1 flagellar assembly protein FliW [Jeotgalibacillus campisalis]